MWKSEILRFFTIFYDFYEFCDFFLNFFVRWPTVLEFLLNTSTRNSQNSSQLDDWVQKSTMWRESLLQTDRIRKISNIDKSLKKEIVYWIEFKNCPELSTFKNIEKLCFNKNLIRVKNEQFSTVSILCIFRRKIVRWSKSVKWEK